MSEPKLISPLLDNFNMGDPISDEKGIRCCPAIENETENRYIVKIISVPEDPSRLDALLLSGAYASKEDALSYYSTLAEDILNEAKLLEKLSQLDAFLSFDGCQIEPMEDGNGFDVYLLGSYGTTLKKRMRNHTLTHLEALNLGLDLCTALTAARRCGYLYADLKPDNVFITVDQSYRIGDLGFLKLDGLKYASLPDRYRSQYTAPEISDAYSALNTTLDVYAVGLVLYQVFNGGTLPFSEETAPNESFPAPAFADYEMAEIILKACAPDPADRWQEPADMGKALVDYMQRNGAHDTPITPQAEEPEQTQDIPIVAEAEEEEAVGAFEATEDSEETAELIPQDEVTADEEAEPEITEESIFTEDEEGNLTFITDSEEDETLPDDLDAELPYTEVSEELSDMLQQADDLIAHEAPEPVVQPEPVDIPIPPPIEAEEEISEDAEDSEQSEDAEETEDAQEASDAEAEDDASEAPEETDASKPEEEEPAPKKKGHWARNAILIALAVVLLIAGIFFYRNFYLQPIEAILLEDGPEGTLTVLITTKFDESKLTVVCSDTYGNKHLSPVKDGKATFTELSPNSAYTVKVVTDSFHKLTGDITAAYTTPVQTSIVQLTAVTGSEESSVILSFAIEGPDHDQWAVSYTADDGNFKETTFAGHTVTLNGFTVGKSYTFKLAAVGGHTVTGNTEVSFTASKLVKASNLMITGCVDNTLNVAWSAPEDVTVESWTVRCYNDSGFDQTTVTSETTASFPITDTAAAYTVEVTAAGMSVSERAYAQANSITVTNFCAEQSDNNTLKLSWESPYASPAGGWKVLYTINGSAPQELSTTETNAVVTPVIPGCEYVFTLQPADGTGALGGMLVHNTEAAAAFSGYDTSADNITLKMCCPPDRSVWDYWDAYDFRTSFKVGEKIGFTARDHEGSEEYDDTIVTLFVIRDESGAIVDASSTEGSWDEMWVWGYGQMEIPTVPQSTGNYSVEIYFNGALVTTANFTIY